MSWHSSSEPKSKIICCPRCHELIVGCLPSADHHPIECSFCSARLLLFSASERNLAVDVENAPTEIREFIRWTQSTFDELQFVCFFLSFEELLGIDS